MTKKPRIIIVGTGGAGLAAAIEAANYDVEILLVTKGHYQNKNYKWASSGGCTWKTHGFNAAIKKGDSVEEHVKDTIKGGAFANNKKLVETLCAGAVNLVDWLSTFGIVLDKNGDELDTRPFGGCGTPRSVFIEDRLGFYIQKALNGRLESLIEEKKVSILEYMRALELLKDENNNIVGLKVLDINTLEYTEISCSAVIIADGGGASMYAPSAASCDKTCDGITMALNAGASIIDMEFVQFHPTGIVSDVLIFDGSLVEEVLRFDGARLINKHGARFMFEYNALGEIATRDEVARGIYSEIVNGNGFENNSIRLDITSCKEIINFKYPALFERLNQSGYDIKSTSHIYIRPTAHFLMGGIKINEKAETEIAGLYAAGESAGGVHGANRLSGNGLSEALVFGRIAGENAAKFSLNKLHTHLTTNQNGSVKIKTVDYLYSADALLNKLRRSMYWLAGPIRNISDLKKMLVILDEISNSFDHIDLGSGSRASMQIQQYFDLKSLVKASEMIVKSAILRDESRGSHYLSDHQVMKNTFRGIKYTYQNDRLTHSFYQHDN